MTQTLFTVGWKDEVRAYLEPFKRICRPSNEEEARGEWGCYAIESLELTETAHDGAWGMFLLGDVKVNYLDTPQYGGEESQYVLWADKQDFTSPLLFWAAATTVYLSSETGFTDPWFDFRVSHREQTASSSPFTIREILRQYGWPEAKIAIPAVIGEPIIRCWAVDEEWNNTSNVFESSSWFCFWNWHTSA